jgi:TnpA family transposase
MKILNNLERETFESPPQFNSAERKQFFALSKILVGAFENLRTPTNRACFVLTAGYFRAQRRFFGKQFHPADVAYVARQLGIDVNQIDFKAYDKQTMIRHQNIILKHFGVIPFNPKSKSFLAGEIAAMVRVQLRPKLVFVEVVQILTKKKIAVPSYSTLSTMILVAMRKYHRELVKVIETSLTKKHRKRLDELLNKESGDEASWRYPITLLKKPLQSTKPARIKNKLVDLKTLLALYLELQPVITALNLNTESIRYYAYCVIKSQIPQVSRRVAEDRYLLLIMFVVYQTFKLHDALIDTLLSSVQSALNAAEKEHKESYYKEREGRKQSFVKLATTLKSNFTGTIAKIRAIINDAGMSDHEKVSAIEDVLDSPDPKQRRVEEEVDDITQNLSTAHHGRDYYDLLEEQSLKLQNRVAEMIRQVQFNSNCSRPALLQAVQYYQRKAGSLDKNAPIEFMSAEQRAVLFNPKGKFRVSLYKVMLFTEIADAIRAGALNLVHSDKYRSLDEYLIPKEDWQIRRDEYLQRADLDKFANCSQTLEALELTVDACYQEVNENLSAGKNHFLKLRKNGTFHVSTPKQEETDSVPLSSFFPDRKYISLLETLATVSLASGFLSEFEHWQARPRSKKPHPKMFFAGIIGYGCDIGHRKLAQISKQINENELETTVNWYFSLANVQGANDRVLQLMDRMSLPNIYRQQSEVLHTSSDGQKFEVAVDSLNANYSFKYLGKEKGVSVVSFIDMRHLLWHSTVISSSEREAAFVIDGLMHNDVVKSDIHSTDTHGYSEVIFASTFLLGFMFAPRIKGLGRQTLYSFKSRKHYEQLGYTFLPSRYINAELIKQQWDDILRFIATIRLKVTTASQLFKRLNSYSKQHPLYQALKEFGKIQKTLFILRYINDPAFRQAIEKQLNKVESAQKFSKAISFGHNNEFIQSEKEDQEIAEGCRRLIKNSIICWNYLYLAQQLAFLKDDEDKKTELLNALRSGSIVTWRHFNLHGEFDFSDERMEDSIGLATPKNLLLVKTRNWEVLN